MLGTTFKNDGLRQMTALFGTLFNNISIQRFGNDDVLDKVIPVPLSYGPIHRYIAMARKKDLDSPKTRGLLPRMSFEIASMTFDPERNAPKNQRLKKAVAGDETTVASTYSPAPWNISFELGIITKNSEDAIQIIEQIVPFFKPAFSVTLTEGGALGIAKDIPIILESVDKTDSYEGDLEGPIREIIYTITFLMKGFLYQSIGTSSVIRDVTANVSFDVDDLEDPAAWVYNVVPNPTDADLTETFEYTETIVET